MSCREADQSVTLTVTTGGHCQLIGSKDRSLISKVRVYNKRTQVIMESINVKVVDQDTHAVEEEDLTLTVPPTINPNPDDQIEEAQTVKPTNDDNGIEPAARIHRDHLVDNIIG
ncbi:hypothetical protein LIER_22332 [Lithospermum erythrorhizon]|uniref:Uncharacterized protein n=1 Tax=Lithospermum erythrorhizon TaxID=34254 RepID=A0AAV3QWP2_LITER